MSEPSDEHPKQWPHARLAGVDTPCTRCGYNLRGAPGPRCPECGTAWPLRPREGAVGWAIGLAGMIGCYAAVAAIAATAIWSNILVGLVAGVFLLDAPNRVKRWVRTKRAFGTLLRHRKQQRIAGWWLACILGWTIARQLWFGRSR